MTDLLSQIQERYAKAVAKVDRAEKALESARSELADLEAAKRVIDSLSAPTVSESLKSAVSETMAVRQHNIIGILGEGAQNGVEPKELHAVYALNFDASLSLDTFRTTIWRMKDKPFTVDDVRWTVQNDDGRYWKERERSEADENPFSQYATTNPGGDHSKWDFDDPEVPF